MFLLSMTIGGVLASILDVLTTLILVEWAVTWLVVFRVLSESSPFVKGVKRLAAPLLDPVRRVIPPQAFGGFDISPAIVIVLLQTVAGFLRSL